MGQNGDMRIHLKMMQASDTGFPCGPSGSVTVEPLSLSDVNVTPGVANDSNINPLHLKPSTETGGYVFHLPVGNNLDLPTMWTDFTYQVNVHCTGSAQSQPFPTILVRRFATTDPLQVYVVGGQPQWNRAAGRDTFSFTIKSNRAVSIESLLIRDKVNNNVATQTFNDLVDSTSHSVDLAASQTIAPQHAYIYDLKLSSGGMPVSPTQALSEIDTPPQPTQAYALQQTPSQAQLTIKDPSSDISFTAMANDSGSLDVVFDTLTIQGSNTLHGTTGADGLTHSFKLAKADVPADGQYSFHFVGTRTTAPSALSDSHESILIVSTKTVLSGPIGLSLKSGQIVVSYCLSQKTPSTVKIAPASNTNNVYAGADGQASGGASCSAGATGYTANVPLTDFSSKVQASTSTTPTVNRSSSTSVTTSPTSSSTAIPIQLFIIDTSSGNQTLATLNLDAVLLSGASQSSAQLTSALQTITSKDASDADKATATKTLTSAGLSTDAINSLAKNGKKIDWAGTVGTILGTLGKSVVSAYLGIPAAATPATTPAAIQ